MSYPIIVSDIKHSTVEFIDEERRRQNLKFGVQNHDDGKWALILGEEFGEACQAVLEGRSVTDELVQLAAVAVAWIEAIERR